MDFFVENKPIKVKSYRHMKFLLFLMMFSYVHSLCSVSHKELWSCALRKGCLNAKHLHFIASQHESHILQRPYIMAIEGPRYKRLFQDCDSNNDGCLDMTDIENAGPQCQRSCMWRTTMKSIVCN